MTDHELLEAAAKAAALWHQLQWWEGKLIWATGNAYAIKEWNPLTDDGDALRLAVKLDLSSIMVFSYQSGQIKGKRREFWTPNSGHDGGKAATTEVEYAADPCAATRRAIVRAAAAMGAA